jgi:hypothetical protein
MWSVGGTLFFWMERPAKPIVKPPLEPQTEDQRRLLRRVERLMTVGVLVSAVVTVVSAILHVQEALTGAWLAALAFVSLSVWGVMWRTSKALKESGPPYDRGVLRLPRPTRW